MSDANNDIQMQPQLREPMVARVPEPMFEVPIEVSISPNFLILRRRRLTRLQSTSEQTQKPSLWMRGGGIIGDWYVSKTRLIQRSTN